MKTLCFLLALIGASTFCSGQKTYQKILGDTGSMLFANDLLVASDNHMVLGGQSRVPGDSTFAFNLTKVSLDGQLDWTRSFEADSLSGTCVAVKELDDGGFILAGHFANAAPEQRISLIRTNAQGNVLWSKAYGNDTLLFEVADLIVDHNGAFMLTGTVSALNQSDSDLFILQTDSNGQAVWVFTLGGPDEEVGIAIRPIETLGFAVVGSTKSFGAGNSDVCLAIVNGVGDLFGFRTFGTANSEKASSVVVLPSRDFVISAEQELPGSNSSVLLFKTDQDGLIDWAINYDGVNEEQPKDLHVLANNNYLIAGSTQSTSPLNSNGLILEIDTNGGLVWAKAYGQGNSAYLQSSIQLANGERIVAGGSTHSQAAGNQGMYLLRTDSNGTSGCQEQSVNLLSTPLFLATSLHTAFKSYPLIEYTPTLTEYSPVISLDTFLCDSCYTLPTPTALSYTNNALTLSFNNPYSGATTFSWDFGDGSTLSNLPNPTHTFASPGTYNVCVTATGDCSTDTLCDSLTVTETGLPDFQASGFKVYPNPMQTHAIIELLKPSAKKYKLILFNVQGQQVEAEVTQHGNLLHLSRGNLKSGLYLFQLQAETELVLHGKLLVE